MAAVLLVITAASVATMAATWPSSEDMARLRSAFPAATAEGTSFEHARVEAMSDSCSTAMYPGQQVACIAAEIRLTSGPDTGDIKQVEILGSGAESGLQVGDHIEVIRLPDGTPGPQYAFSGIQRGNPVIWFTIGFVVCVIAVARWRGFRALLGLGMSIAVLAFYILPAVAAGHPGAVVGLAGSIAIMFVIIYVAHGLSIRTTCALISTIAGLVLSTGLGMLAVSLGRLSGIADETDSMFKTYVPDADMRQLLICSLVIAGLGVLNDVTITQVSAVWEIRHAAPQLSATRLYQAGMRIGRDHIASTIYTIVFAYAGAAMTTLVGIVLFFNRPLADLLSAEMFGSEVLRTLASAIGLVLTVPLTTAIACLGVKTSNRPAKQPAPISS